MRGAQEQVGCIWNDRGRSEALRPGARADVRDGLRVHRDRVLPRGIPPTALQKSVETEFRDQLTHRVVGSLRYPDLVYRSPNQRSRRDTTNTGEVLERLQQIIGGGARAFSTRFRRSGVCPSPWPTSRFIRRFLRLEMLHIMTNRKCSICKILKPLFEFHRSKRESLGREYRCKECRKFQDRSYEQTDRARSKRSEFRKKYEKEQSHKVKAKKAVHRAIRKGALVRQPCEICGEVETEAHHDDYNKDNRLDVRWLCRTHHSELHAEQRTMQPSSS